MHSLMTFLRAAVAATWALLAGCASTPAPEPPPLRNSPPPMAAAPAPMSQPQTGHGQSAQGAAGPQYQPTQPQMVAAPTRPKATGTPEDARRHMVRGAAAIEAAKNLDDLAVAVDEFRMATEIAPNMAPAWYNLGSVLAKTGPVGDAVAAYRRYLTLAPDAADAQKVGDEIIKLEFHQERIAKEQASSGTWMEADGTAYQLQVTGTKWRLSTTNRPIQPDVEYRYGPGIGSLSMPIADREPISFNLELRGNKLSGTWQHPEIAIDKCTLPAETGEVQGELNANAGTLILEFTKARYKTVTSAPFPLSFETNDKCTEMSVQQRRAVRFVFRGPVPAGGIGVYVTTAHGMMGTMDWIGELRVTGTVQGSPAELSGLYYQDMVLAIDGVAVKALSAGEAIFRLRGAPGSSVRLTILRPSLKDPVEVNLQRQPMPVQNEQGGSVN